MDKNIVKGVLGLGLALGSISATATIATRDLLDDWFEYKADEAYNDGHKVKSGVIAVVNGGLDVAIPAAYTALATLGIYWYLDKMNK